MAKAMKTMKTKNTMKAMKHQKGTTSESPDAKAQKPMKPMKQQKRRQKPVKRSWSPKALDHKRRVSSPNEHPVLQSICTLCKLLAKLLFLLELSALSVHINVSLVCVLVGPQTIYRQCPRQGNVSNF